MRRCSLSLCSAALVLHVGVAASCTPKTEVELYVDGFQPKNVRFEVEDQGPMTKEQLDSLAKRRDVDGASRLPDGACGGPCRVAIVSVFVHNLGADAQPEPPPVIRLKTPPGKPERQPIAYRGDEISKGRIGRIRWVVEMWPEEKALTAVLSSSVRLFDAPSTPVPQPQPQPTPTPTPTTR